MYEVAGDLEALYKSDDIEVSDEYAVIIRDCLGPDLAYSTPAMYGLAATTFSSKEMIAHDLVQNSIDETKGAARVCVVADRYAGPGLFERMKRHVRDERNIVRSSGRCCIWSRSGRPKLTALELRLTR